MKPLVIFILGLVLAALVYPAPFNRGADFLNEKTGLDIPRVSTVPFRLGLDLVGGTHLVYEADLSDIAEKGDAMEGVRDVIERRVNLFGVAEPIVQIEGNDRLIVELAGVKDINQAIKTIGETPFLEFKEERDDESIARARDAQERGETINQEELFQATDLTGKHVKRARVSFHDGVTPSVELELSSEGGKIFEEITERNVGKTVAIYLDGQPISIPVVQGVISGGRAIISGNFTIDEAKELAIRLNAGALPVPIKLISQQTIGASLGADSLNKSLKAGLFGLLMVAIFMIVFYRLPGFVAVYALVIYVLIVLMIYKFLPVTLTLAGMAGFILSLGIAVDANILIFARMREEIDEGKSLIYASEEGFRRAWNSIRDSHVTTSIVKGFALTLGVGILVSLFTATVVTKQNLKFFLGPKMEKYRKLFK
jgi:preprotein translocase subunit SecD